MAQTTYTTQQVITLAMRARFYRRLCRILEHLDAFNLNLISIVRNANGTVSMTLSDPLPVGQTSLAVDTTEED